MTAAEELQAEGWKDEGSTVEGHMWSHPDVLEGKKVNQRMALYIRKQHFLVDQMKNTVAAYKQTLREQPIKIVPLKFKYIAYYTGPTLHGRKISTIAPVEFVGLVGGDWVAMVMDDNGKLVVASELPGFTHFSMAQEPPR